MRAFLAAVARRRDHRPTGAVSGTLASSALSPLFVIFAKRTISRVSCRDGNRPFRARCSSGTDSWPGPSASRPTPAPPARCARSGCRANNWSCRCFVPVDTITCRPTASQARGTHRSCRYPCRPRRSARCRRHRRRLRLPRRRPRPFRPLSPSPRRRRPLAGFEDLGFGHPARGRLHRTRRARHLDSRLSRPVAVERSNPPSPKIVSSSSTRLRLSSGAFGAERARRATRRAGHRGGFAVNSRPFCVQRPGGAGAGARPRSGALIRFQLRLQQNDFVLAASFFLLQPVQRDVVDVGVPFLQLDPERAAGAPCNAAKRLCNSAAVPCDGFAYLPHRSSALTGASAPRLISINPTRYCPRCCCALRFSCASTSALLHGCFLAAPALLRLLRPAGIGLCAVALFGRMFSVAVLFHALLQRISPACRGTQPRLPHRSPRAAVRFRVLRRLQRLLLVALLRIAPPAARR